jgi:hypothetical protein
VERGASPGTLRGSFVARRKPAHRRSPARPRSCRL